MTANSAVGAVHWSRAEPGNSIWFPGALISFLAEGPLTGGQAMLVDMVAPLEAVPPRHVHSREDEVFHILEGRLTIQAAGQSVTLLPGDTILGPRHVEHAWGLDSGGRWLVLTFPAGLEGMFRAMGSPAPAMVPPPDNGPPPPEMLERFKKVCDQFGVPLTGLGAPHPSPQEEARCRQRLKVVRSDQGQRWRAAGLEIRSILTAEDTQGRLSLWEETQPPGQVPPPHIHRREDEAVYCLQGAPTVVLADRTERLRPGDFAWLPRGQAHAVQNHDSATARTLHLTCPGGFERFFAAAAALPGGSADQAAMLETARAHGIDLLG